MIICLTGATATGKTSLSLRLAKDYNGEIINADSAQVYKGLDIGTAKITKEEQAGITHHLFDIVSVTDEYNVYEYQKASRKVITDILSRGKTPILVGGSGLYIKACLYNYCFEEKQTEYNNYENISNEELKTLVNEIDKNSLIHINNRQRLISFLNNHSKVITKDNNTLIYDDVVIIELVKERDQLYKDINFRVDKMLSLGLVEEVKSFFDKNIKSKALETLIGYKEVYSYLEKRISYEQMIDLIKKNTRHYAKRQLTWFNHQMSNRHQVKVESSLDKTYLQIKKIVEAHDESRSLN